MASAESYGDSTSSCYVATIATLHVCNIRAPYFGRFPDPYTRVSFCNHLRFELADQRLSIYHHVQSVSYQQELRAASHDLPPGVICLEPAQTLTSLHRSTTGCNQSRTSMNSDQSPPIYHRVQPVSYQHELRPPSHDLPPGATSLVPARTPTSLHRSTIGCNQSRTSTNSDQSPPIYHQVQPVSYQHELRPSSHDLPPGATSLVPARTPTIVSRSTTGCNQSRTSTNSLTRSSISAEHITASHAISIVFSSCGITTKSMGSGLYILPESPTIACSLVARRRSSRSSSVAAIDVRS